MRDSRLVTLLTIWSLVLTTSCSSEEAPSTMELFKTEYDRKCQNTPCDASSKVNCFGGSPNTTCGQRSDVGECGIVAVAMLVNLPVEQVRQDFLTMFPGQVIQLKNGNTIIAEYGSYGLQPEHLHALLEKYGVSATRVESMLPDLILSELSQKQPLLISIPGRFELEQDDSSHAEILTAISKAEDGQYIVTIYDPLTGIHEQSLDQFLNDATFRCEFHATNGDIESCKSGSAARLEGKILGYTISHK